MSAAAASAVSLETDNPFPGLRAFAEGEGDRFFGREQQIGELVSRLAELQFIAVSGNSGCGKSSLVRAGLLRELSRRAPRGGTVTWLPVVMSPGDRPIANLSQALAGVFRTEHDDEMSSGLLYGQLKLGGLGLVEAVKQANLVPRARVLLVVDQFEELFRLRQADADEASAFVKLLLNAALDVDSAISVIITVRSDFLGECAAFHGLPEAVNRGLYLVPRLTREQRKAAMVGPVELRSQRISARLVQRILNDVSDDFDDLPIMQHALARTWDRWLAQCQGSRAIDLEDYTAIGTTSDAISLHADEAADSTRDLPSVERVFRALTELRPQGAAIRRALTFERLCEVVGDREAVTQVVERFRRPDTAFLQPGVQVPLANNPVIDISHESLIRQWRRLRTWVRVEAESAAMLRRLLDSAARRASHQASLWRGAELKAALRWKKAAAPTAAWVELYAPAPADGAWRRAQRFLTASRRGAWLEWAALAVVPLAILVLLVLYIAQLHVETNRNRSSLLASRAEAIMEEDPARSARLALDALKRNDQNEAAATALRKAMTRLEMAHTSQIIVPCEQSAQASYVANGTCDPVRDIRYSSDGKQLLVASGKTVWRFAAGTFESLGAPITRQDDDIGQVWLLNGYLVTKSTQGKVQIQHLDDGVAHPLPCPNDETAWPVAPTLDGRLVALGCQSGDILIWDVTHADTPVERFKRSKATATALDFSADGLYLLSGDADGKVTVWKRGQPGAWIEQVMDQNKQVPLDHGHQAIRDVHFSRKDPNVLVSAGDDGQAIVWKVGLDHAPLQKSQQGERRVWRLKHQRSVSLAEFYPEGNNWDGVSTVFTISGKNVQHWVSEVSDAKQVRGHDDWILDAQVSSDGWLLVTASADGTAKVWASAGGSPLAVLHGHHGAVNRAIFSAQNDAILTASDDGTVRVWRVHTPQVLSFTTDWKLDAAFDPTGKRVAIADESGGMCTVTLAEFFTCANSKVKKWQSPHSMLGAVSWSADASYVLGVARPADIDSQPYPMLWAVGDKEETHSLALAKVVDAVFRPAGDELLTINLQGQLALWNAKQLTAPDLRPLLQSQLGRAWGIPAISPDGQWIAAVNGVDIELWRRTQLGSPPRQLSGFRGSVRSLQFSSDSTRLIASSDDRSARIWLVGSPSNAPLILDGAHTGSVYSAVFDPTGRWVATGSSDGTIGVWDARSARLLAQLHRHREGVNAVRFSSDGKSILSASDDGMVILDVCEACTLPLEDLERLVQRWAPLTDDDRDWQREAHPLLIPAPSEQRAALP